MKPKTPTSRRAKPGDDTEQAARDIEAQVQGGLSAKERERLRNHLRGMAGSLAPLRDAPLPEGIEPSFIWMPVAPQQSSASDAVTGKKRKPHTSA